MNNLYLKSYLRCKRKAWLDFKGEKSYKIWSPHKPIETITQYKNFFKLANGDLYSGLKGCKKGYKGIVGIKITSKLFNNTNVKAYPQLLLKTNGQSKWGKYKYLPATFKLGHRTTKEHLYDLAFCSILLEPFQKTKVEKGLVVSNSLNKTNVEVINLDLLLRKKVLKIFLNLIQTLDNEIPDITEDRKKCAICSWQSFCDKEAKEKGFLTDLDGIGSKTALLLKKNYISNVQELSISNELKLGKKLFFFNEKKYEKASKFIKQSKSYISGNPIRIGNNSDLSNLFSKKDSGFFFFDIESNPDEKHDFLYGFLAIKNLFGEIEDASYTPILNLNKNNEESYKRIIEKLLSHESWPVLHYGETEKIAILNLAKIFNLNPEEATQLKTRFIDLHEIIRKSWILPIKNYSLKKVANWTGFKWEQFNVSGSKALYWWILYQNTLNQIFLKKIIKYNRDDCLATLHITKWLFENQ